MLYQFVTGAELLEQPLLIQEIASIHCSNDRLYIPTLQERYMVESYEELKCRLEEEVISRATKGHNYIIGLLENGEVVAFNSHTTTTKRIRGVSYDAIEVGTTCVHPNYQNKGIGSTIYSLLEGFATERYKAHAITRITWSTNLRQRHLYEQYAYRIYMKEYGYYGLDGLDRLHFYKILSTL